MQFFVIWIERNEANVIGTDSSEKGANVIHFFFSLEYSKIQNIPGDKVFIRANFSRTAEGEGELTFCKDDILEVESTVYRGTPGLWLAWLVDQYGDKVHRGTIPSRVR